MKREILFRAKRVFDNKFEYGYLLWHYLGSGVNYFINNNVVINETVGQYTGMTDKNGTKIFEGDIIMERYKGHERTYSIVWDNDYFSLRAESEYTSYQLDELLLSYCEVIGNIHDNKELLS